MYEDVIPFLKRLDELKIPTYIYSSGSVHAQKLLFGHTAAGTSGKTNMIDGSLTCGALLNSCLFVWATTHAGDLLHFFKGHFDTTIGLKVESPSYDNITKAIGVAPEHTLFATDNILEVHTHCTHARTHHMLTSPRNMRLLPM